MNRIYKYRLYPTQRQRQQLDFLLWQGRNVYNLALEQRIEAYKERKETLRQIDQQPFFRDLRRANPDTLGQLNYGAILWILRRLDIAYSAFFRRIKNGETPGHPRFKGRNRFNSLTFTYGNGCKIHPDRRRVYIQNVGEIRVKLHRPLPDGATVKAILVKRTARGWYACLFLDMPDRPIPEHGGQEVGVDVGLYHLLALSDGTIVENPRWLRQALAKLRVAQRRLARRKKGSNRWHEAARQVARLHEHIANQRRDFWHKVTRQLADTYGLIALEDLTLSFMTANHHLALSAHDAGLATFRQLLEYKAESAGAQVVTVNPAYTSQVCSGCGMIVQKELGERVHVCPECGLVVDRDINAARNVLLLALNSARTGRAGANVAGCGERSLRTMRVGESLPAHGEADG
jgi:putative transposase